MTTVEINERLTRVGPGTPCGELMRRYWIPIAPSAQLDEEPVRKVRVLGEDLVLFRAVSGALGLIGDRCLHRAVDLQFGMPDGEGLRCPYHGWLYGTDGRCLETPLEDPNNDRFRERLRLSSYPLQELGGLIFAYLGPEPVPLLPPWDLFVWPNSVRQIGITTLECNWLQCHENTGDPTHGVYLHGHFFKHVLGRMGQLDARASDESHTMYPRMRNGTGIKELYANPTRYGMEKGIVYAQALGAAKDFTRRHSTVVFPFYTQTGYGGAPRSEYQIRVPMDDTHTYHICYQVYAAPPDIEAPTQDGVPYYEPPLFDEAGKPILDYVLSQDILAWRAQGTITDRTREHLGRTDLPIVFLRRQLEQQIGIVEDGGTPMNVFHDPNVMGTMLHGSGEAPDAPQAPGAPQPFSFTGPTAATFRAQYHKGFVVDDADRYGPAVPLVQELHRRIAEATKG
jgi:5,5'-dehydrodivanillate O-demethylase oxygenase subunit